MIGEITAYLINTYSPKAILIHGSRVRGDYVATSDYDLVVVTSESEKVSPHIYKGCSLDVYGIDLHELMIETSNKTPIWPIEILFDDNDRIGLKLCKQTHAKFLEGPKPLTKEECTNRFTYTKRLLDRIVSRGEDPMIRNYYLGDFYERMVRYWFKKNHIWTVSFYRALTIIENQDPEFYNDLQHLWNEDYLKSVQRLFEKIFKVNFKK